jgi:hypothetical protein
VEHETEAGESGRLTPPIFSPSFVGLLGSVSSGRGFGKKHARSNQKESNLVKLNERGLKTPPGSFALRLGSALPILTPFIHANLSSAEYLYSCSRAADM